MLDQLTTPTTTLQPQPTAPLPAASTVTVAETSLKNSDVSHVAAAIRALFRVAGDEAKKTLDDADARLLERNHDRTFLTALEACQEHGGNLFEVHQAALGALMNNERDTYFRDKNSDAARSHRRVLAQRWSRAFASLDEWQNLTGYQFVELLPGGKTDGEHFPSKLRVNVQIVVQTIKAAKADPKFRTGANRRVIFDKAAAEVLATMPQQQRVVEAKQDDGDDSDAKREHAIKCGVGFIRNTFKTAVDEGYNDEQLDELEKKWTEAIRHIRGYEIPAERDAAAARKVDAAARDERMDAMLERLAPSPKTCEIEPAKPLSDNNLASGRVLKMMTGVPEKNADDHHNSEHSALPIGESTLCATDKTNAPVILDSLLTEQVDDRGADGSALFSAMDAIDAAASVGAERFNVMFRDDVAGTVEVVEKDATVRTLIRRMPEWLRRNEHERRSLIIDMKSAGRRIIQVDEANADVLELLADVSFLQVETSDGNGQSWIALPRGTDDATAKEITERLFVVLKTKGANRGASGGLRWVGSRNYKPCRRRADGTAPRVRLVAHNIGRITTADELDGLGLLAAPQPQPTCKPLAKRDVRPRRVPSYSYADACVKKRKPNGEVDRSGVDVLYAATCLRWGFDEAATAELINTYSSKAQSRKDDYAGRVVAYAAAHPTY